MIDGTEANQAPERAEGPPGPLEAVFTRKASQNKMETRVNLRINLTKYSPDLVSGLEGFAILPTGKYAAEADRYVTVRFPGKKVDVMLKHLEIPK